MSAPFLFQVLLQGAGTSDVEGLSSYLCRLAISHNVPVGVLLRNCYEWHFRQSAIDQPLPYLTRNPGDLAQYVRPNELTKSLLDVLTAASGQPNLRSGTFMCFEGSLQRCMKTFHRSLRWCPFCLSEFERAGIEPYLKLSWSLAAFSRCPLHGAELEHQCPQCRSRQDGFGARRSLARCVMCDSPLSKATEASTPAESWRHEAPDLIELVERIGCEPDLQFPYASISRLLRVHLEQVLSRAETIRGVAIQQYFECLWIVLGQVPVTLVTARRVAYWLGITVLQLLEGKIEQTSEVLDANWSARLPPQLLGIPRVQRHDRKRLSMGVTRALSSDHRRKPSSLAEVARSLKVSTGCLRYHFPTQSKAILDRHSSWRRQERERKQFEARCAVVSYLAKRDGYRPLTHKGALRAIRKQTSLPKDLLRAEIAEAIDSEWSVR